MTEPIKKKTTKKSIFSNTRIINEEMLKFIVYNIEKFEIKCVKNDIKTDTDMFHNKITEILKDNSEVCFNKIAEILEVKKIFKDDKEKLAKNYQKMYTVILQNKL